MANSQVNLLSLDPDTAKAALITYMQGNPVLQSFAFDGTVMNEILSVLAVNDYKLSFYMNMINSESWLDSAQLRSSVISHAKDLNYIPRSATSSTTMVNVKIPTDGSISVISIPIGTTFSGRVGTSSYNFSVDSTNIYTSSNGTFLVSNLNVYEGNYVVDSYIMDYSNPIQEFIINNANVDISSLTVTVSEDGGASVFEYNYATSLLGISATSLSYFIQCNETEQYEVLFGNGLFGRQPQDGALITLQYRITVGDRANGVQNLTLNRDVTGGHMVGTPTVTVLAPTSGGAPAEDIESIRFSAPRHYATQERAVNESDYETLLRNQFPEIQNVAVFGGETLNPPLYGQVLISLNIANISGLPQSKQVEYTNYLKPRSCMRLNFTTPDTLYYQVNSTVNYDVTQTTLNSSDLSTIITAAISSYNSDNLEDFKVTLRYSRFCSVIDSAHPSIISNETNIYVYKKIIPVLGTPQNLIINLVVPIYNTLPTIQNNHPLGEDVAIWSSAFTYNGISVRIEDDSNGTLFLVKYTGSSVISETFLLNVGTVNYATGVLTFNNFALNSFQGDALYLFGRPATKDISVSQNNLMGLEVNQINLNIVGINP